MNVLVTGATGVVGSRVVPLLIGKGHRVTAIGRSAERLAALRRRAPVALAADLQPEAQEPIRVGAEVPERP